jgi:hypothetical protein
MAKLDPAEVQKRMARISQTRCPYRDRKDRCTAEFRCRNQQAAVAKDAQHTCGHDGAFDYRTAWESRPLEHDRIKKKVRDIRDGARRRRNRLRRDETET